MSAAVKAQTARLETGLTTLTEASRKASVQHQSEMRGRLNFCQCLGIPIYLAQILSNLPVHKAPPSDLELLPWRKRCTDIL